MDAQLSSTEGALELEMGGFPRSGHEYLSQCLMDRYSSMHRSAPYRHDHSFHRAFIRSGATTPFLVPVRDPREALISDLVMGVKTVESNECTVYEDYAHEVDSRLDRMTSLWETLLDSDKFFIVPFIELVSDKDEVIRRLEIKHPELRDIPVMSVRSSSDILESISSHDKDTLASDQLERGHVPRAHSPLRQKAIELAGDRAFDRRLNYLYDMMTALVAQYGEVAR